MQKKRYIGEGHWQHSHALRICRVSSLSVNTCIMPSLARITSLNLCITPFASQRSKAELIFSVALEKRVPSDCHRCMWRWRNEGLDVSMTIGLLRRACFLAWNFQTSQFNFKIIPNPSLLQMQRMNLAEALHDSCWPNVFQFSWPRFLGLELDLAEAFLWWHARIYRKISQDVCFRFQCFSMRLATLSPAIEFDWKGYSWMEVSCLSLV